MARWIKKFAAPEGSIGNNTHAGVEIDPGIDLGGLLLSFIVEAIGATPTVTYKWQVSADDPSLVSDANAIWTDLNYILYGDTTEAVVATTRARTTLGSDTVVPFVGSKARQLFRRIRLVVTSNTNVQYRAAVTGIDSTS